MSNISNSEEANKYYTMVNNFIDEYTDKHKINPSKLGKYLKNSDKLKNFLERKGLKDISGINRVIDDVLEDRMAIEKDVKTFESFTLFESEEFKIINLKRCLYKGIEKSNIHHEKILADYFDVSLGHIDIIDSDKHLFKVETLEGRDVECVVYTNNEIEIIRENIKEFSFEQVFNKEVKLEGVGIDLNINVGEFIDNDKFEASISKTITSEKVKEIIRSILKCRTSESRAEKNNFVGLDPDFD